MHPPEQKDGRHKRSEATRGRLLEAAAELFCEFGFPGTTLDAIARRAGVNKALIRYHFGGKKGIYSQVLLDAISIGRELLAPVRDLGGHAAEPLEAYVDALGVFFERCPHFGPTIVREWMSAGANVEPEVMSEFLHFFNVDREILETGQRKGELRATDPHATHLALLGSLVFFQITRAVRQTHARPDVPALDTETFRNHVKEFLRLGLRP
ncbi:MAG: TetR/AcrR family transcriptional regulator [Planctomycetota bacterium]|jgi:TetR/AcrR family transcriptional regulator